MSTASPEATAPTGATPSATPDAPASGFVPAADPVPLEVLESGFTVLPDDASGTVTYVAILRNPNTEWAFVRANVLLDLQDDAGDFLAGADVTVTLLPGQTSAIAGQISGGAGTAALDVRPPDDLTAFLPRPATEETFDAIDVSTRSTGSGWLTTGTLVSRFETTQTFVEVVVVHRDASGAVRGGATGGVEVIEPGQEVTFDVLDAAPFQDIGATEVYWRVTR